MYKIAKLRLGTYGGHLELSAFAHMTKRNVKVIQPGLVYVIEWDAGSENKTDQQDESSLSHPHEEENNTETHTMRRRDRKRLERERGSALSSISSPGEGAVGCPVYVAYVPLTQFIAHILQL
jgi:OTU domain-containing protein 3